MSLDLNARFQALLLCSLAALIILATLVSKLDDGFTIANSFQVGMLTALLVFDLHWISVWVKDIKAFHRLEQDLS